MSCLINQVILSHKEKKKKTRLKTIKTNFIACTIFFYYNNNLNRFFFLTQNKIYMSKQLHYLSNKYI